MAGQPACSTVGAPGLSSGWWAHHAGLLPTHRCTKPARQCHPQLQNVGGVGQPRPPAGCACRPAPYYNNMPPRQHGEHTKVEDQSAVDTGALRPRPMAPPESVSHAAGSSGGQEATTHPSAMSGPILAAAVQGTHHLVAGCCSCRPGVTAAAIGACVLSRLPFKHPALQCRLSPALPTQHWWLLYFEGAHPRHHRQHTQTACSATQPSQCTTGVPETPTHVSLSAHSAAAQCTNAASLPPKLALEACGDCTAPPCWHAPCAAITASPSVTAPKHTRPLPLLLGATQARLAPQQLHCSLPCPAFSTLSAAELPGSSAAASCHGCQVCLHAWRLRSTGCVQTSSEFSPRLQPSKHRRGCKTQPRL